MPDMSQPSPTAGPSDDAAFRTLWDFLPIGAYRSLPSGQQLRANPALVRLNGYDSEAQMLAAVHDIASEWYVLPDRRERFLGLLHQQGHVRGFVSEVYRHKTRERIWISENAHAVDDGRGGIAYIEGTVEEVTEQVRAQAALARNELTLRQIAEHIPGMAYRVHYPADRTQPLRYSFVSPGVRTLYGVEPEALLADAGLLRRFRHPDDVARVDAEVAVAVRQGLPLTVAFRILTGGQVKWVQMNSSAVVTEHGEQVRVGVMLDMTAQRQAEALRRERDQADTDRRQMTRFLSRVSHELRTPLNGILGFAQLIDMEADTPPRQREWAQALLRSGRHLVDLVTDVLDLSAAQSGQMMVALADVDLAGVLREAWGMVRAEAQAHGLCFGGVPLHDGELQVRADRRRLLQVVVNLLSNAVKYNRPGGPVDLTVQRQDGVVAIAVTDGGPGMDAGQQARLFRPFDRLGAQLGTVPGTGLGLALSRQLTEAMGGTLQATSTPGQGCTFTLQLPAAATLTPART